ncbi:hypothetical protein HPP92_014671 [Vanilla planifolia]|uniref:Uncharacterized protein n=1 Tax=Vanilla planifolia TaxID=51239 RepID=A0A835UWG2_VANPL|nr:hypothetical protein HPP92_014671 [Vanilla planifolia]
MAVVAVVWWIGRRIAGEWAHQREGEGSGGCRGVDGVALHRRDVSACIRTILTSSLLRSQRARGRCSKRICWAALRDGVRPGGGQVCASSLQGASLQPTFPASKERMLGPQAIFFQRGSTTPDSAASSSEPDFMPDAIRAKQEDNQTSDELEVLLHLEKGLPQLRRRLISPGHLSQGDEGKAATGAINRKESHLFEKGERWRTGEFKTGAAVDLLASFMDAKEALTDDQIADNIIGVMFAARDTTASVLTWILKYLAENPSILEAVAAEQEDIRRSKKTMAGEEKCSLNWADTKVMPITCRVIQETMRVASHPLLHFPGDRTGR